MAARTVCSRVLASAAPALRPTLRPVRVVLSSTRALSTSSRLRKAGKGQVAQPTPAALLAQALDAEISHEASTKEELAAAGRADVAAELAAEGVWTVVDQPGGDEIALERDFGNEKIRVVFSAEVDPSEDEIDEDMEEAEEEEYEEGEAEREAESAEETEDLDRDQLLSALPVRASISIAKPGDAGALQLDVLCRAGEMRIDRVAHLADARVAIDDTVDADWTRGGLYGGPIFADLDPSVQDAFLGFLDERGVNDSLATAVVDMQAFKEQKEYVHWLTKVRSFIAA